MVDAYDYSCWIQVLAHPDSDNLEFILEDTAIRNGRVRNFYSEALWGRLHAHFKHNPGISVPEYNEYGTVSFRLEAETPQLLQKAIERSARVVETWSHIYNVPNMRRDK